MMHGAVGLTRASRLPRRRRLVLAPRFGRMGRPAVGALVGILLLLTSSIRAPAQSPTVDAVYFGDVKCGHCDTLLIAKVNGAQQAGRRDWVESEGSDRTKPGYGLLRCARRRR